MEILQQYLPLILLVLCAIIYIVVVAIREPKKIQNWLVFACAQAEKALGSGTGKLKLRHVYDMFIAQFPIFSVFVSFDKFSSWVDIALEEMKEMIENNEKINALISGDEE